MKIYRVESSFSILNYEDAITIRRDLCVQITPYRSIMDSWSEEWLLHVGYDRPNFMHHSNDNKRIPLPHEDKLLVKNANIAINTNFEKEEYVGVDYYIPGWFIALYHFAFASEYDMMRWFTREEREELASKGFYLAVYEVPEDKVIIGGHQVMFRKSHAELKGFITLD
ncbi:putative 19.7 kDa protein [Escherichia phage 310Ecol104PP]|nr:putative 19.7 kDa protein [Escherichia phage 310Ecol104PP]